MSRKVVYPSLSCELTTLDAARCQELLTKNTHNRPLRRALAERYMNQMLTGQWRVKLPVMIVLDRYGRCHNGQHTMNALVWAETWRTESPENQAWCAEHGVKHPITIQAVLVTGIDPDDANLLDVGQRRTHGDVVFRQHLFDADDTLTAADRKRLAADLATAAKIVYFRTVWGDKVRSSRRFEHADMLDTLQKHPALEESAIFVYRTDRDSRQDTAPGGISSRISRAYMIAAHYLAWHSETDEDGNGRRRKQADEFVDLLANGVGVADAKELRTHPVHVLREWLAATKADGNRDGNALYDAIVKAWLAFLEEKPIKASDLRLKHDDEFPYMGGVDTPPAPEEAEFVEPTDPTDD